MNMNTVRILVADDHAMIRMGLVLLLNTRSNFKVVGEAENGEDVVKKALSLNPDVVLMDMMMPVMGGVEATRQIKAQLPETKVVLLTSYGNSADIANAVSVGASGALMKDTPNDELPKLVRMIADGKTVFSPEIEQGLQDAPPPLTDRQKEILQFVANGCTSADIGKLLSISTDAVNQHITIACSKLGAANRSEAVAIAAHRGIL